MKDKIKIGFLLDSEIIPAWAYHILVRVLESKNAEIVVVVKRKPVIKKQQIFFKLPFRIYLNFERFLYKQNKNAFENKNTYNLDSLNYYEVEATKENINFIKDEDLDHIENYKADIFINLSSSFFSSDFNKIAKFGVWFYHHGNNVIDNEVSAGFWEVIERKPETSATLNMVFNGLDKIFILDKGYYQTNKLSLLINSNLLYWKASDLVINEIDALFRLGSEKYFFLIKEKNKQPNLYCNKLYTVPNIYEISSFFIKNVFDRIFTKIKRLVFFEQWILLYNFKENQSITSPMYKYKKIIPPKDRFWADPFVYKSNDKHYIFFEELVYKENKGNISVIELKKDGSYTEPVIILEKEYHLSYPFIFEDDDELFMIPETAQNKKIDLYRCTDFPLVWEFEKTLIDDIQAVDATVYKKDHVYWLFCNVKNNNYSSTTEELCIYYSDSLISEKWKKHPKNPVVIDARSSRPAGGFFEINGQLYRPSQDCSIRYGYAFNLNKILELNKENYSENLCYKVTPSWDDHTIATHTINNNSEVFVSDSKIVRFRFF